MATSITKTQRWLDLITFLVGHRLAIDPLTRVASLPNSPFRDATRSALRNLAFDLPVDALTTAPVLFVAPRGEEGLRVRVRALLDAVRIRRKATFTYHGICRDAATERTVTPWGP